MAHQKRFLVDFIVGKSLPSTWSVATFTNVQQGLADRHPGVKDYLIEGHDKNVTVTSKDFADFAVAIQAMIAKGDAVEEQQAFAISAGFKAASKGGLLVVTVWYRPPKKGMHSSGLLPTVTVRDVNNTQHLPYQPSSDVTLH
jgi:hypothetical protein